MKIGPYYKEVKKTVFPIRKSESTVYITNTFKAIDSPDRLSFKE